MALPGNDSNNKTHSELSAYHSYVLLGHLPNCLHEDLLKCRPIKCPFQNCSSRLTIKQAENRLKAAVFSRSHHCDIVIEMSD